MLRGFTDVFVEELGHLRLGQPDGVLLQPDIQTDLTVGCLVRTTSPPPFIELWVLPAGGFSLERRFLDLLSRAMHDLVSLEPPSNSRRLPINQSSLRTVSVLERVAVPQLASSRTKEDLNKLHSILHPTQSSRVTPSVEPVQILHILSPGPVFRLFLTGSEYDLTSGDGLVPCC